MRIHLCPFCGRSLDKSIEDGITTCNNCGRIFDSCDYNRLLSAAWVVRREYIIDSEVLKKKCGLSDDETKFITEFVIDKEYTHDEFLSVMKKKFSS